MSTTIERRISRLERAVGGSDDGEMIELSDEAKDILRAALTGLMTPDEIEGRVTRRYFKRSDHDLVAQLSPVEREQRLLAIRQRIADHPAARAFLDKSISLSHRANEVLEQARRALLEQRTA